MSEWHNFAAAVLLVVMAEITNEVVIAFFRVRNAITRFRIRLISLFSCFFVFFVLPLKMIELFIPSGGHFLTDNNSYVMKGPITVASRFSQFAWISIVLLITAACCFVAMLLFSKVIVLRGLGCEPASDHYLLNLVEEVSRELGVRVKKVMICSEKSDAFVYGYPPTLAVGSDLLTVLDKKELRVVIRHELFHVKKGDTLLKPFFTALCIIFLYNPMVWFLYQRLFNDRECCADRGAITSASDIGVFLSALLKVHDLGAKRYALAVHWMGATNRIDSVFSDEKVRKIPVVICLVLTLSSLFVGADQLFGEGYLEIESNGIVTNNVSFDSTVTSHSQTANLSTYFLDLPLVEWYQSKNSSAQEVRIPISESELVEMLRNSMSSGEEITIRVVALPLGGMQLFRDDVDSNAQCNFIINTDSEGKLFVIVEKIQPGYTYPEIRYDFNPRERFARI